MSVCALCCHDSPWNGMCEKGDALGQDVRHAKPVWQSPDPDTGKGKNYSRNGQAMQCVANAPKTSKDASKCLG